MSPRLLSGHNSHHQSRRATKDTCMGSKARLVVKVGKIERYLFT